MSRALLVFELPDEADLFDAAAHAQDWRDFVRDYTRWLRDRIKYGDNPEPVQDALIAAQDELYTLANVYDLEIEP